MSLFTGAFGCGEGPPSVGPMDGGPMDAEPPAPDLSPCDPSDGQCIFRHDTFGDEQLWTDVLQLQKLVETLPPSAALGVGLKVDAAAVPPDVLATADLEDPATTIALIELNAIVGLRGTVENGRITRIGVQCALCHSTVDDSAASGIGNRLDGWPNRDLDVGVILAMTEGIGELANQLGVEPGAALAALRSWGPGRYDARFNQDGASHPVLIPPAYGLSDVELATYTGEGSVSYWNAYVAVTQMGAQGNFVDETLGIDITHSPDRVTPMLPALRDYQFSLLPPSPPAGSYDIEAAARGRSVFEGAAQCASCHSGENFTDAPTLHSPAELELDGTEANRGSTGAYRTTPLRGAWSHPPYFHNGSAETLADVIEHYESALGLELTGTQDTDLEQYLLSL